jgi:hypothetical protein
MIEKKVEGQEIKAVAPAPRRTGEVVDIFAAAHYRQLLQSLIERSSQLRRNFGQMKNLFD